MMAMVIVPLILGGGLMLLAGIGILRMPDLYTRMHAATKAASLGIGLMLLAAAFFFADLGVATKAAVTAVFVFLTAPVAAHLLGSAAYARKVPLWERSITDEGRPDNKS